MQIFVTHLPKELVPLAKREAEIVAVTVYPVSQFKRFWKGAT